MASSPLFLVLTYDVNNNVLKSDHVHAATVAEVHEAVADHRAGHHMPYCGFRYKVYTLPAYEYVGDGHTKPYKCSRCSKFLKRCVC